MRVKYDEFDSSFFFYKLSPESENKKPYEQALREHKDGAQYVLCFSQPSFNLTKLSFVLSVMVQTAAAPARIEGQRQRRVFCH